MDEKEKVADFRFTKLPDGRVLITLQTERAVQYAKKHPEKFAGEWVKRD